MENIDSLVQVEVERRLSDPVFLQNALLGTLGQLQAAKNEIAVQKTTIEEKNRLINELKPAKEAMDDFFGTDDWTDMKTVAKVLNKKGYGQNNLFKFLKEHRILFGQNQPYQEYVDRGYFKQIIEVFEDAYGNERCYYKTVVSPSGQEFIRKLLVKSEGDECLTA
jgi:phage antirepressor YoqD-like protein